MNIHEDLKDKVCVITGAAGVLCSAMVEALCEAGAKVVYCGHCGTPVKAGLKFCTGCGNAVEEPEEADPARKAQIAEWGARLAQEPEREPDT